MPSYARDSGRRSSCLKHHIDLQDETVYPGLLLSPQASCACEDCDSRVSSTDGDPALSSPTPRLEVPELLDELECLSWRVRALPVPRPPSLTLSDWYGALETTEDQTTLDIEAILETSQDFLASYERDAPSFNREPPSQTWAKTCLSASREQDYPSIICEPPSRTRTQTCLTGSEDSGYGSGPPSPAIALYCTTDLDATPRRYSDPSTRQHLRNFHNAFPEESQLSISSSLDSLLPPLATPRARLAERETRIAMQRYTRSPPPPLLDLPPIAAVPVDTQDEPSSATRRTFRRVWSRLTLKDVPADHSESESSSRSSAENSPFTASFLDLPDPKIPSARDTRVRSRKSRRNLTEAEPESFLLF